MPANNSLVCPESCRLLVGGSPIVVTARGHVAGNQRYRVTDGAEVVSLFSLSAALAPAQIADAASTAIRGRQSPTQSASAWIRGRCLDARRARQLRS
jgi:hypothetical protein